MNLRRLLLIFVTLGLLALGWDWLRQPEELANPPPGSYQRNGYTITPLQPFELQARVLGREDYRFDRGAAVAPTDLALGWGPMAEPQILAQIRITQGNRWYRWRVSEFPIPRRDIETHSANMHLIPATPEVARTLAAITPGETISLSGQLVRVEGSDGFTWLSSLSREDTGDGACELIWVESLGILD
ncbi:hypothetical protein [Pseudomonas sp. BMS12]|uniref:hypothetical protein n=1 Tax=Pseudomonas sp. BMS12 TaxID=1796033 RepID=UPI00083B013D|nr:hypothetical protein [Pseudomonas sp. BMS12]